MKLFATCKMFFGVFLIALSSLTLISAYTLEIVFDMHPCVMCQYERFPHAALLLIGIIYHFKPKPLVAWSAIIASCIGVILTSYHIMIEWGVVNETSGCNLGGHLSSCAKPSMLFGIPLTYPNLSLFVITLSTGIIAAEPEKLAIRSD